MLKWRHKSFPATEQSGCHLQEAYYFRLPFSSFIEITRTASESLPLIMPQQWEAFARRNVVHGWDRNGLSRERLALPMFRCDINRVSIQIVHRILLSLRSKRYALRSVKPVKKRGVNSWLLCRQV